MSSNSIRISADLFELAQSQGKVLSRSAAQQLEYWARLGAMVEANGLAVPEIVALLQGEHPLPDGGTNVEAPAVPVAQLWAHKRAQQQRDIASIAAGQSTNEAMSWFSGGRARQAKAVNSPL